MFIKGLSFINYKKFKEGTELSLEEFTGRIGILGNNGSGKSSLLDIIPIALYGVEAVTGKKEHLRTQGLEKDLVKLRLDFEHGGKSFIIEREFRGSNLTPKASIFEVVIEVPHLLATSAKDVSSYVEKILNMDYSTFIATVFCKQKELSRISAMLPTERRAFILKLSKVDDIDNDIKRCRELRRDSDKYVNMLMEEVTSKDNILSEIENLDKDIKIMKAEHKGALNKLSTYEKKFKDAESTKKEFDEKYEKYNELTLELKDCKNNINNMDRDISRLDKELSELNDLQTYLNTEGNPLIAKHAEIQAKLEELDNIRPKYLEKMQLMYSINKVKNEGTNAKSIAENLYKQATALGFDKTSIPKLEETIASIESVLDDIKINKTNKESELRSITMKGNEFKSEIKKIRDLYKHNSTEDSDCKCPMCKQVVSKEYTEIVEKHYTNELVKVTEEYNLIFAEVKSLATNLDNQNALLVQSKNEMKRLRDLEREYNDIVSQYNAAKQQYSLKLEEYKSLTEKYKQFDSVDFDENNYNTMKKEKQSYDEKIKTVYVAVDKIKNYPSVQEALLAATKNKESSEKSYQEIVERGTALNFNKEQYAQVKQAYDKANLKLSDVKEETSLLVNQINAKDVNERKYLLDKLDNVKKKEKEYNKHRDLVKDYTVIEEGLIKTKGEIMSKINPLINKHFSEIFKTLMNEKYDDVELDDNYNILIYDCGEALPLSRFSGGEQDLCNLSLRLAVSKFLAEMNSGSIEFIVLDEIFASLDDNRKSALIEVLGNLNDFFRQIFIISHEDVIKSSLDHYLTVKENEYRYSEIEF